MPPPRESIAFPGGELPEDTPHTKRAMSLAKSAHFTWCTISCTRMCMHVRALASMHVHACTHMCTYFYAYTSDTEAVSHFQKSTPELSRKLHVPHKIVLFQGTGMGHAPPRKSNAFLGWGWGWGTFPPLEKQQNQWNLPQKSIKIIEIIGNNEIHYKNNEIHWKIHEAHWRSMKINENHWKSLTTIENH